MSHTSITLKPPAGSEWRHAARWLVLSSAWRTVAGAASRLAGWHRRRREIKRNIAALSQLSDHMLKDIGIHRSQIRSVVHSGRDRCQTLRV